jgi:hypothetical protein
MTTFKEAEAKLSLCLITTPLKRLRGVEVFQSILNLGVGWGFEVSFLHAPADLPWIRALHTHRVLDVVKRKIPTFAPKIEDQ